MCLATKTLAILSHGLRNMSIHAYRDSDFVTQLGYCARFHEYVCSGPIERRNGSGLLRYRSGLTPRSLYGVGQMTGDSRIRTHGQEQRFVHRAAVECNRATGMKVTPAGWCN